MSGFLLLDDSGLGFPFADKLLSAGVDVWVCTPNPPASVDSHSVVYVHPPAHIHELDALLRAFRFTCVVDCRACISLALRQELIDICRCNAISYYRLIPDLSEQTLYTESLQQALEVLTATTGRVLITLPTRTLEPLSHAGLMSRCFIIAEPMPETITLCQRMGLPWENLLCIPHPLNLEIVTALLRKTNASVLLAAAGDTICLRAALEASVTAIAVGHPPLSHNGYTFSQLTDLFAQRYHLTFPSAPTTPPFPLLIRIHRAVVRIFGGSDTALTWAKTFSAYGASVELLSPQLHGALSTPNIRHIPRAYLQGDCRGAHLVLALTANPHIDEAIAAEARRLHIPCHICGAPHQSDFLLSQNLLFAHPPDSAPKQRCTKTSSSHAYTPPSQNPH